MLLYSGEYDLTDGPNTQDPWVKLLHVFNDSKVQSAFWAQPRNIYYVQDPAAAPGTNYLVGGYYRDNKALGLTLLTVPKAGHFVPTFNYLSTANFLQDYITNGRITCHKKSDFYCETGPTMCKYTNSCYKNGVCHIETGRCVCNEGFFGQDCSEALVELPAAGGFQESYTAQGIDWLYFQFNEALQPGQAYEFRLVSSNPMDIYVSKDLTVEPNEFKNDIEIKKQSRLILRSDSAVPAITSFTAAVRVNGASLKDNKFFNSTVIATFNVMQASEPLPADGASEDSGVFSTLRSWAGSLSSQL